MTRTCSHIKTNGTKCGSPALRHQTLCYFHYHWDRRERRRIRLGGPVGMNKNTGLDLPILEGPESIMLAIMEVQHALIDARIDRLTAHTLLYSLQLAMQLKIGSFSGLSSRLESVTTCPELEDALELDRARGLRPSKEVCSTCLDTDSCTMSCHPDSGAPFKPSVGLSGVVPAESTDPEMSSSRPRASARVEGPASSPTTTDLDSPTLNPCHPERSHQGEAERPSVSSPEVTTLESTTNPLTPPALAVETRNLKLETFIPCVDIAHPALKGGAIPVSPLRDECGG